MKNYLIGAIHFPPMPGYLDFPGYDLALQNALLDLHAYETGGVNAVIIENNYDIPHTECISKEVLLTMISLGKELKKHSHLPFGVSVLWNDFRSAFIIAKEIGAEFIRVPVFVDDVETSYGIMRAKAEEVCEAQKNLDVKHIKIYADIHVKHATIISPYSIEESALLAKNKGADAIIITGKWTGDAPVIEDLEAVRSVVGDFSILCGSGVDEKNIQSLFAYANGAIVSTSLKEGIPGGHINIKPYNARIDINKVTNLVEKIKS